MPFRTLRPRTTRSAKVLEERSNAALAKAKAKTNVLARACKTTGASATLATSRHILSSDKSHLIEATSPSSPLTAALEQTSRVNSSIPSTPPQICVSAPSESDFITGATFDGDGPQFLKHVVVTDVFDSVGRQTVVDFEASVAKGFFRVRNNWTCYRRNYIAVAARLPTPPIELQLADGRVIDRLSFSIAAITCDRTPQQTQLVQHTAKRDKGPQLQPAQQTVAAPSYTAAWERLQFRTATANNGKKKTHQQYFSVRVTLSGIVFNNTGTPDSVVLAHSFSEPVVVRGRSPGHYNDCAADEHAREDGTPMPDLDRVCYWLNDGHDTALQPQQQQCSPTQVPSPAPQMTPLPNNFEPRPYIVVKNESPEPMQVPMQSFPHTPAVEHAFTGEALVTSAQSNLGSDYFSTSPAVQRSGGGLSIISPLPQYKLEQPAVESLRQTQLQQIPAPQVSTTTIGESALHGARLPTYAELSAHLNATEPAAQGGIACKPTGQAAWSNGLQTAPTNLSREEAVEALFALQSGA